MKKYVPLFVIQLAMVATTQAFAADSDEVLARSKKIQSMEHRDGELKLQASMADSYRKMADAGFVVDDQGMPVGVKSLQALGDEVRAKGGAPMPMGGAPFNMDGLAGPGATPFVLEQPTSSAGLPGFQTRGAQAGGAQQPPAEKPKQSLQLAEVRANSVIVMTDDGLSEVKVGQKVYDLKLKSFDIDTAYFEGPNGSRIVKIDWTQPTAMSGQ